MWVILEGLPLGGKKHVTDNDPSFCGKLIKENFRIAQMAAVPNFIKFSHFFQIKIIN